MAKNGASGGLSIWWGLTLLPLLVYACMHAFLLALVVEHWLNVSICEHHGHCKVCRLSFILFSFFCLAVTTNPTHPHTYLATCAGPKGMHVLKILLKASKISRRVKANTYITT